MIELSELIRDLRAELETAIESAPAEGLRFELGPIELEVNVGIDKSLGADAKVRFWVIEMGPETSVTRSSTQRIKLTLTPQIANTSGRPYVAGTELAKER